MSTEYLGRVIPELLADKEAAVYCGMSTSMIWAKAKDPDDPFPKPIKISAKMTRWRRSDLQKWAENLTPAA